MIKNNSIPNKIFWRGFWVAIIFLLIIYFSAVSETNKILSSDEGEHVVLSNGIGEAWGKYLPRLFGTIDEEFGVKVKGEIEVFIDKKIDAVFYPVYGQIPKFAEFHYSVKGEYKEIVAVLEGQMGDQVRDVLFKEVGFDGNLQKGLSEITGFSLDKIVVAGDRVNRDIQDKMALGDDDMNVMTKTLQLTTQDVKNRFTSLEYTTIRGAGVAIGFSATGNVLAKTMGKKLAAKIAAKTAVKATAKGATILGGAGTGAATCAVGGPVAAGVCGVVGGILSWFAVDKVIVEIDEHFNREDFEKELRKMVDEQKQEIKSGLKASYSTVIAVMRAEQKNKLKSVTPNDLISN
jgi:hypothetical protein